MIPKTKPYYNLEEIKAVFSSEKNPIERFEKEFAKVVGAKYALTFPYGRTAIYALLKIQKITNKEVIIPAYTCIVVPNAIISSGNRPKFVDISLKDYNLDISKIKITSKTGAIIPAHMYGYPCNIKEIRKKTGKNIFIIEDAALALLTRDVGKYSDAVFYSFNLAKQMCTFDGSIVTTNRRDVYEKLKAFRNENFKKQSLSSRLKRFVLFLSSYILFSKYVYGLVYRLASFSKATRVISNWDIESIEMPSYYLTLFSDLQAKLGLAQLEKLKENIGRRIELAEEYDKRLKKAKEIVKAPILKSSTYSHYTIRVKNREEFLKKSRVSLGRNFDFDYFIPHTNAYKNFRIKGDFKNSIKAAKEVVNLPLRANLRKEDVELICKSIKRVR